MPAPIQLIAVDIDGTLLNSSFALSPQNREAVRAAHRAGIEVVLVTGRRYTFARPILTALELPLTLISSCGAVVKSAAGETLLRRLLPRDTARAVLERMSRFRSAASLLFDKEGPGEIVVETLEAQHPSVVNYFRRNRRFIDEVARLEDALSADDPIQILYAADVATGEEIEQTLRESDGLPAFFLARTAYPDRDFVLLDVLRADCNKGTALASYAASQKIAAENVMAIGDNWNDLEMLEFAGRPVLMGNSSPELKERGWQVTADNDSDGVAQAIRDWALAG